MPNQYMEVRDSSCGHACFIIAALGPTAARSDLCLWCGLPAHTALPHTPLPPATHYPSPTIQCLWASPGTSHHPAHLAYHPAAPFYRAPAPASPITLYRAPPHRCLPHTTATLPAALPRTAAHTAAYAHRSSTFTGPAARCRAISRGLPRYRYWPLARTQLRLHPPARAARTSAPLPNATLRLHCLPACLPPYLQQHHASRLLLPACQLPARPWLPTPTAGICAGCLEHMPSATGWCRLPATFSLCPLLLCAHATAYLPLYHSTPTPLPTPPHTGPTPHTGPPFPHPTRLPTCGRN